MATIAANDQYQRWLMRHGYHWNDIRSATEDACREANHAEANWDNDQPRDVVREHRIVVDGETFRVRITDQDEVWTRGAEWKLCGSIDWADGIEATIRNASEIVEAYVRAAAANDTTGK